MEEKRFEEIRRFVKRIFETWLQDSQLPSINKLAEALTNYGLKADELTRAIAEYREHQQAQASRNALRSRIVALFGILVITMVATLLWWRIGQVQQTLPTAVTVEQIQAKRSEFDRLTATFQALRAEAQRKQADVTKLDSRLGEAQEQLATMARTIQALAAAQTAVQDEVSNLQRLNQQFQFRLMQMDNESGPQVVIQVPPDANPITVDGKRYIVVSPPEATK